MGSLFRPTITTMGVATAVNSITSYKERLAQANKYRQKIKSLKYMGKARATRKRRAVRRSRRRIQRKYKIPTLQPKTHTLVMKSCHYESLDGGAGALTVSTHALNGCNDPWLSADSIQPLGFDQWSTLYRKYCVIGWKARVEVVTTDNTNSIVVGYCPLDSSTALASYMHYKEATGNKSVIMTPDIDKAEFWIKGGVERILLGSKKRGRMLTDTSLYADVTANPTRVLYGHLYCQSLTGSADAAVVYVNITLYQTVVWFDPIIPARS